MKIGIFQDVHANLPAFKKAIELFRAHECQKIYHVGDLIGIGPHPKEVFEMAIQIEELVMIMGNHDYWYAFGLPQPIPSWMSEEEVEHQKWNHKQLGEAGKKVAQSWKFVENLNINEATSLSFLHYGYDSQTNWFKDFVRNPDSEKLDQMFAGLDSEVIFYGHHHEASDLTGKARYVNLGSAGCYHQSIVRIGILEIQNGKMNLEKISAVYNDNGLMEDFEKREVPASAFIKSTFITRP